SGTAPLSVTADASASSDVEGPIASYRFDFGDGTVVGPQSGATATHTYAAGSWNASVQVTDAGGLSATKSVVVAVARPQLPPAAAPVVTPSSDVEGPIASYRFDFGDGTVVGPQSGATATHTYAAGSWTASVQVTDAGGLSATKSVVVAVARNLPPTAALTVTPSSGVEPLSVTADASASSDAEGPIASYRFDFGDGTVLGLQSGATATHTYAAGSWTASVQVTDAGGLSATASVAVSVSQSNPNLVGNPSFETNIDGWAPIGGATLARVLGGSGGSYS